MPPHLPRDGWYFNEALASSFKELFTQLVVRDIYLVINEVLDIKNAGVYLTQVAF